jgi:diadenosine tetraphosphate (Ap4A) HIT family hydrolase
MHATIAKFGYPGSLVHAYQRWVILLRPQQATLGACVLACVEPATSFAAISDAAFAELPVAIRDLEGALRAAFRPDKLNYLMLMMVDPHVHYHVLPRYGAERRHDGQGFADPGWPGMPDLHRVTTTDEAQRVSLRDHLRACWPGSA